MSKLQILKLIRDEETQKKYDEVRKRIKEGGLCPFCDFDRKINEVIEETKYCLVFKNAYPYEKTRYHIEIIPKRHIKLFSELADENGRLTEEGIDYYSLVNKYKMKELAINISRGNNEPAKTIAHVHDHILSFYDQT